MSLVVFVKHQLYAFFPVFFRDFLYTLVFFRVYRPNIVIDIVLMVHQPLKPPIRQILEAIPRPDPRPELDTPPPSYQILENTLMIR